MRPSRTSRVPPGPRSMSMLWLAWMEAGLTLFAVAHRCEDEGATDGRGDDSVAERGRRRPSTPELRTVMDAARRVAVVLAMARHERQRDPRIAGPGDVATNAPLVTFDEANAYPWRQGTGGRRAGDDGADLELDRSGDDGDEGLDAE